MATYRATQPVYVDEQWFGTDELFTTDAPKGKTWEEVDAKGNPVDPLDHDANGKRGGSKPRAAD